MNPRISFVNTRLNDIKTSVCLTEVYRMLAVLPSSGTSDVLSTLSLMDEQNSCDLFKQQEESSLTRKEGFLKKVFISSNAHGHIHVTT